MQGRFPGLSGSQQKVSNPRSVGRARRFPNPTMNVKVPIDLVAISDLCRRWRVTELSLFGSVLRDDFRPDSDIDVLVTFATDAPWSLLDLSDI